MLPSAPMDQPLASPRRAAAGRSRVVPQSGSSFPARPLRVAGRETVACSPSFWHGSGHFRMEAADTKASAFH